MPTIMVAGTEPGAGATTVAAGLAHRLAYAGNAVRLVRLAGDERAEADARTFARLEFADAGDAPVEPSSLDAGDGVTVIEAPVRADVAALAQELNAALVLVGRPGGTAPEGVVYIANHAPQPGLHTIPEDRTLAAPTVRRLIEASRARVLARSEEGDDATCEYIVVGPISHDPGGALFRRFTRPCIVTRAEKVDIVLAAMSARPVCVILTGGGEPSPYVIDRVSAARETTLLLAPEGTVETVRDIEGCFGAAPFSHETKVERIGTLMRTAVDEETLERLAGMASASRQG